MRDARGQTPEPKGASAAPSPRISGPCLDEDSVRDSDGDGTARTDSRLYRTHCNTTAPMMRVARGGRDARMRFDRAPSGDRRAAAGVVMSMGDDCVECPMDPPARPVAPTPAPSGATAAAAMPTSTGAAVTVSTLYTRCSVRTSASPAAGSSDCLSSGRRGQVSRDSSSFADDSATAATTVRSTDGTGDGLVSAVSARSPLTSAAAGTSTATATATVSVRGVSASATPLQPPERSADGWSDAVSGVGGGGGGGFSLVPTTMAPRTPTMTTGPSTVTAAPAAADGAPTASMSAAAAAAAATPTLSGKCQITVKQWDAVAMWSWGGQVENCAICKNALADVCVECQTRSSPLVSPLVSSHMTGGQQPSHRMETHCSCMDKCTISWGCCRHVFHSHCISRWLVERKVCPLCGRGWDQYETMSND